MINGKASRFIRPSWRSAVKWMLQEATVYGGIEGYGASTRIHRARHLLSFSSDAPITVTIIDSDEKIGQLIPAIEPMLKEGLIAVSNVEVIKYVHDKARTK